MRMKELFLVHSNWKNFLAERRENMETILTLLLKTVMAFRNNSNMLLNKPSLPKLLSLLNLLHLISLFLPHSRPNRLSTLHKCRPIKQLRNLYLLRLLCCKALMEYNIHSHLLPIRVNNKDSLPRSRAYLALSLLTCHHRTANISSTHLTDTQDNFKCLHNSTGIRCTEDRSHPSSSIKNNKNRDLSLEIIGGTLTLMGESRRNFE